MSGTFEDKNILPEKVTYACLVPSHSIVLLSPNQSDRRHNNKVSKYKLMKYLFGRKNERKTGEFWYLMTIANSSLVEQPIKMQDLHQSSSWVTLKAMSHKAIFLATFNATRTNKKPFKLQRGCYTQATCLARLRKVEGHSTFLATCNATFAALQVERKIAFCNMALILDISQVVIYSHDI